MNRRTSKRSDGLPRAWGTLALVWFAVTLLVVILFQVSRYTAVSEIRRHAMGVAIAVAAGISADDVRHILHPDDQQTPVYARVQRHLDRAVQANPDIRYIYLMRKSAVPFSPSTAYEYVVDQPARDYNKDGVLGPDERQEPVGKPYDATHLPALQEAWHRPTADQSFALDHPYPELLSGYAPLRDAAQRTVGVVGVDIMASTVHDKFNLLRWVCGSIWLLVGGLSHGLVFIYYGMRESRDNTRRRNVELRTRNELLRRARSGPAAAPAHREPHLVFDRFDLAAAARGGGLFRLFELDQDHFGVVLADSRGDAALDELTSCMVDLLLERVGVSAGETVATPFPYVDAQRPAQVLHVLGHLLAEEMPEASRVGLLYGVVDFSGHRFPYAVAGGGGAVLLTPAGAVSFLPAPAEPAVGPDWSFQPTEKRQPFADGDYLVVCLANPADEPPWLRALPQAASQAGPGDPLVVAQALGEAGPVAVLHMR